MTRVPARTRRGAIGGGKWQNRGGEGRIEVWILTNSEEYASRVERLREGKEEGPRASVLDVVVVLEKDTTRLQVQLRTLANCRVAHGHVYGEKRREFT